MENNKRIDTVKLGDDRRLKIETISPATEYQEGDLQKFFGIDPDFTGDLTTEEYLDDLRGESTEDYLKKGEGRRFGLGYEPQ